MEKKAVEKLIGRDDVLTWAVVPERCALVAVCEDGGSIAKITVAHHPDLDDSVNAALARSGLRDARDLNRTNDDDLAAIKGIGPKSVDQIRKVVNG